MFSSYTDLKELNALEMMNLIPAEKRTAKWNVLYDAMASAMDIYIPQNMQIDGNEDDTNEMFTNISIMEAQMGQGAYRAALIRAWGGNVLLQALSALKCC